MDEIQNHFGVHAYDGQTVLNPLGLLAILVLGMAMCLVPRRYAMWPIILMACFIAPAQRIVVLGLNFTLLRLMVLFGWARALTRGETVGFRWKLIDVLLLTWAVFGTVAYTLLRLDPAAFVNRLGNSYDAVGSYFLFRCLIRDWDDIQSAILGFIVVAVPVTLAFTVEFITGHNLFAFLGGVPEITVVRDGRLRCQGAFAHPILAGTFWAALLPLMAARWWNCATSKLATITGIACSLAIIVMCASSGPVAVLLIGVLGAIMFPLRSWMRWIRWSLLFTIIGLHLLMKAPVWNLLSRVDFVGGSTGWHRYILIDEAIQHFSEWWLIGVQSTLHWGDKYQYPLFDITNQYILEGVQGGVLTMILFIATIAVSFGSVGRIWRAASNDLRYVAMAWALGVALLVHVASFIAVSYFGQIIMVWYMLLAIIANLDPGKRYVPAQATRQTARKLAHRLAPSV